MAGEGVSMSNHSHLKLGEGRPRRLSPFRGSADRARTAASADCRGDAYELAR